MARGATAGAATVSGTVAVEFASIRTDGPKHERDVVVALTPVGREAPNAAAAAHAAMDQSGLVFVPHVLAIQRGTTVTFLNSDREQHNVYFLDDRTGETLDIGTWGPGVSVDHTFAEAGTVITLCKLHLEMAAFIVVVDTPHFVRVALDGDPPASSFVLDGVPPGRYELSVWHKKLKQMGGPVLIDVRTGDNRVPGVTLTSARRARAGS